MIKNERQLQLASAQVQKLQRALQEIEQRQRPPGEHPRRKKLELNALRGQIAELSTEIAEYEALRTGRVSVGPVRDLAEIPNALIRQRIAKGLTQRDLAGRLGVAEQQVQRDEASDYVSASLDRLKRVASALDLVINMPIYERSSVPTVAALTKRLVAAGFEKRFVERRLESKTVQTRTVADAATPTLDFAARLTRMFGWNPSTILSGGPLSIPTRSLATAYKRASNASTPRRDVLSSYAEYCAHLVLAGTEQPVRTVPPTAETLRRKLRDIDRHITFSTILRWSWSVGIMVFPLNEPGGFHALVMRDVSGRSVVVLKQRDQARWAFDLLHEIAHLARHPDGNFLFIEETAPEDSAAGSEEFEASRFAAEVLLGDCADAISDEAIDIANGLLPRLKDSIRNVAVKRNVPLGALALHTAYRLSQGGQPSFWGAAANLAAEVHEDNRRFASDALFQNLHWDRLHEVDRDILLQALSE